jgi:hypothetical protein
VGTRSGHAEWAPAQSKIAPDVTGVAVEDPFTVKATADAAGLMIAVAMAPGGHVYGECTGKISGGGEHPRRFLLQAGWRAAGAGEPRGPAVKEEDPTILHQLESLPRPAAPSRAQPRPAAPSRVDRLVSRKHLA